MLTRRVVSTVGAGVALLLVSGCVGDRLPALDRLGVVRGSTGDVEVVFFACESERVEGIVVRWPDGRSGAQGDVIWQVDNNGDGLGHFDRTPLGHSPPGFATVVPLNNEPLGDEPVLIRVATNERGVVPMTLRPSQARVGEVLTRQDTYQSRAEFESLAAEAC